jgi:hypothetical protein
MAPKPPKQQRYCNKFAAIFFGKTLQLAMPYASLTALKLFPNLPMWKNNAAFIVIFHVRPKFPHRGLIQNNFVF